MLVVAAVAHSAASIPLVVIGGAWLLMAIGGRFEGRRYAQSVHLEGQEVTFISPTFRVVIPASDITVIKRSRWDMNHSRPIRVETVSAGTIKLAPRLHGLFELSAELKRINPAVGLSDL